MNRRYLPFWVSGSSFLVLAAVASAAPQNSARPNEKAQNGKTAKNTSQTTKTPLTGAQLFQAQCAACHGTKGEGTDAYARPLAGNQPLPQLTKYVAENMPPGGPKMRPEDAKKVSAYIYDAFYSPIAQERNRPARIALSRLTVRQMRNSVADLLGSFRGASPLPQTTERGLKAAYFKARNFSNKDRLMERVDPEVKFDFGTGGPSGGEFNPHEFTISWDGGVVVADTGVYEFIVRTDHATRLFVNGYRKPIIDAWVKSGKDTEFRSSVYLIGGRAYPIRLEFSKSTQGVSDTEKKKGKPAPPAFIELAWKRPQQAEEPIPARNLVPTFVPESFVVTAAFPPDDRSMGYERGDSVSKAWDDATTNVALETADYIQTHLKDFAGSKTEPEKIKAFCRTFVERALRQPLDAETERRYITKQFATAPDMETAVRRVVLITLKSPRFLYRELGAKDTDAFAVASRLSFALWDAPPDETLLKAAASGQLATRDGVQKQAERMIADPRAWYKQREFFLQWLKVDSYPDLHKDSKKYPEFTPTLAADLRTSFDLTLENVVRSERSDFRELMQSNTVYLNGRLAKLYGVNLPENAGFQPVVLDPKERAGILSHPYLLSSFAYVGTSSPIHRGVMLARSVMGRTLQPPPAAFTPLDANLHPKLTTRQRVTLQTKTAACMSCHSLINSLGFTFEKFDAIGRFRETENGQKVDASGAYVPRTGGNPVKFNGAPDLARFTASSDEVHAAFVEKMFQFTVKQPVRAYGSDAIPRLQRTFRESGYNMRRLLVEIATEAALPQTVKTAPEQIANRLSEK
jgi:mono/diheme cytochrome c family protein